jgi:hypothetical protein
MRIHPDDVPLVESAVLRARTVNEAYEMRHRIVRANGSVCEVEGRGAAAVDAAGAGVRVHGVLRELTGAVRAGVNVSEEAVVVELVRAVALGVHDAASGTDALQVAL